MEQDCYSVHLSTKYSYILNRVGFLSENGTNHTQVETWPYKSFTNNQPALTNMGNHGVRCGKGHTGVN